MRVRCNWCFHVFPESKILYDEKTENESCPFCGEIGYLMDFSEDINN